MNNYKQVDTLIAEVKAQGLSVSDAAWEVALACVDFPYVYGAWGDLCTPAERRKRLNYNPDKTAIKKKCQVLNGSKSSCEWCVWYPNNIHVRCYDCRGFTDWVLKQFGIELYGDTCGGQWNTKANWLTKGTIDTIPENVLVCLFVYNGSKFTHTGFGYKGMVCDCGNNVTFSPTRAKKWTHWAIAKGVTDKVPDQDPDYRPTLRRGDKGQYVTLAQTKLIQKGYSCGSFGADGEFGAGTEKAVRAFQKANVDQDGKPLAVDGVIGQKTWWALEQTEPATTYTVTIPHLSKSQADALIRQYPGATMTEERGQLL